MNKSQVLGPLLEELRNEGVQSDASIGKRSEAILYVSDDVDEPIFINAEDCKLVFANADTVDRLLEALDNPENPSVTLVDIVFSDEMLDILERRFSSVDEM